MPPAPSLYGGGESCLHEGQLYRDGQKMNSKLPPQEESNLPFDCALCRCQVGFMNDPLECVTLTSILEVGEENFCWEF
jgi:hypothetical protein